MTHRSLFLVLFGVLYGLIGWSYLQPVPKLNEILLHRSLAPLLEHVSLHTIGWGWITVGALMVIGGADRRVNWIGFGVAMVLPVGWVIVYLTAWLAGHNPRGWVTAAVYTCLAVAIGVVADIPELPRRRE